LLHLPSGALARPFEEALGLEKSWHMLHYLLTGHLSPEGGPGEVLMTGEEVGEDWATAPPGCTGRRTRAHLANS
jgi:uncharacterized protein DUF1877